MICFEFLLVLIFWIVFDLLWCQIKHGQYKQFIDINLNNSLKNYAFSLFDISFEWLLGNKAI